MLNKNIPDVPKEKFDFVQRDEKIFDQKFDTKPIGYFMDAWIRFRKNKGSVVGGLVILILLLFSAFAPFFSTFETKYQDSYYTYTLPKNNFFAQFGIWDGTTNLTCNQQTYDYYNAIPGAIVEVKDSYPSTEVGVKNTYYDLVVDTYYKVGYAYVSLTKTEFDNLLAYQEETGKQMLYPMIDLNLLQSEANRQDANYWFKHNMKNFAVYDANGEYQNIYKKDEASEDGYSYYVSKMNGEQFQVRVLYFDYFTYKNGHVPEFLFGSDGYGQDIFIRLANGGRLSFILAIAVSALNIILGTIYGAIEGYYGGTLDIVMERIAEFISTVPFMIVAALFQMYFARKVGVVPTLLFAFVLTGWIGPAGRVRSQFYRFKGHEYVMAARTLGAKDRKIIFRHILPNAMGTLITSLILSIPSVIFTESSLTYLGIVDLQSSNITSIGTLLSNGQTALSTYPHAIFFPALFISFLMISFNLFGNGLRDALNPALRGAD